MRALFLLLVLANLTLFAWTRVARDESGAETQLRQLQIAPERIRLLRAMRPSALQSSPGTVMQGLGPAACLEWGVFSGPAVARAAAALAALELPSGQVTRSLIEDGGYWVYMPPQRTRADAERKVGELKALGVTEFFVVQDPAEWRYAISLGIFRSEASAEAYLAKLRRQGVRSAIVERREGVLKQVAFHLRDPDEALVARMTEVQHEFPGSELKAAACPAGVTVVKN